MSDTESKSQPLELPGRVRFLQVYREELTAAVLSRPDQYAYPVTNVPAVLERMTPSIIQGSFVLNTPAFRQTCRRLGIRHTYHAVKQVIDRA